MFSKVRRFIFLAYPDLGAIPFKKLDKICERLYIFIDTTVESLPFAQVRRMQKYGDQIRWIVGANDSDTAMLGPIAFQMGKLHEKVHVTTEFVVLSEHTGFDSFLMLIRKSGRSAFRLRRSDWNLLRQDAADAPRISTAPETPPFDPETLPASLVLPEEEGAANSPRESWDEKEIEQTVRQTFQRLIESGNRPAEVETLKSFILIHHPELIEYERIDRIIENLVTTMDIEIHEGEVVYKF